MHFHPAQLPLCGKGDIPAGSSHFVHAIFGSHHTTAPYVVVAIGLGRLKLGEVLSIDHPTTDQKDTHVKCVFLLK